MSQYQDDDFSKAYTTALYRTKGTISLNVLVKNNENLAIDLLFVTNPQNTAWSTEDLGLFDALMKVHPTIFVEHYSGYLQLKHVARCLTRMDLYLNEEAKAAKKQGGKLLDSQKPFTWILATGCSAEVLKSFGAKRDRKFGTGVYRLPPGFQIGIVVIRSLPEIPATLWLRGLGKNQILTQAFADIRELPGTRRERNDIVEVCIKHFKYLTEKPPSSLSEEEEDFMKTMQEIDAIYKSEMSQARLEGEVRGRQEQGYLLVLRQLARRFGNVSIDLQEKVKSLPLEKVETLGEDLLDFAQLGDLLAWFEKNN
jgi:Domain of unknown function (DUF4351)